MPGYDSTARVPFAKGGRVGAKHGKYVRVPTPHADISKYITKNGKSEGPKGEDTQYRKKDSTMKAPEEKKSWITKKIKTKKLKGGYDPEKQQDPKTWITRKPKAWITKKAEGGRIGLKKGGDDKWIQKVDASIKRRGTKGKCTPITKPGCTGKAKALAKTFKKMAAKRKAS